MYSYSLKAENLYFAEPRLQINSFFRFINRLIIYCGYTLLAAATITFLISDISSLFWVGIFLVLFLGDRLLNFGKADRTLADFNPESQNKDSKINVAQYLSPASLSVLEKAIEMRLFDNLDIYPCLAKLLIKEKAVKGGILRMDVSIEEFEKKIDSCLKKENGEKEIVSSGKKITRKDLISKIDVLVKFAFGAAISAGEDFIEPGALFAGLALVGDEKINRLFDFFSIKFDDLENALVYGRFHRELKWFQKVPGTLGGFASHGTRRHRIMNRAWTARPTPTLDGFSEDLTDLAQGEKIGFLIGHQNEYERLIDTLARPGKPNALLVGEPGVGKETLVAHLAFNITKDKVPPALFDKRLVSLRIGNLISGAAPDEISKRVNKVAEEIILAGNIILCIPDIHNLTKTSGAEYLSAADIIIPILTSDSFPVVGATYPKEFKQSIEPQSDFAAAFEIINVEEISDADAIRLLTYDSIILEAQYKMVISFGAIKQAVSLARKYFHQKPLPGSAEDLLKETITSALQKSESVIRGDDVVAVAERKTNIPIHMAGDEEAEKLLNMEEIIHQKLINQKDAVSAVSRSIREYRSGLSRRGGPISVFLFVGPTGVGKTELAKILAKIQFGSEKMMIRFDMSEYQDKQSIYRFIGSPDGKLAGNLTESVLQKPYSLILLDEFEKANPDILNLFLQVFDDGRLTDNLSRTIDFTNTIIIATSNAHSEFIKTHIEAHTPIVAIEEELKKKLTDFFRPELLNRFSSIIVFKPLGLKEIEAITAIQLNDLIEDLMDSNGIGLDFDEAAVKKIAELGFDPVFGGRPLRGVISEKIRSVLAEKVLKKEIVKGSNVKVSLENGEFKFS